MHDADKAKAWFVADIGGTYTLQLKVSDGTDTDTDDITVTAEVQTIGSIDQNTTLKDVFADPTKTDYMVSGTSYITADLTIEPGVRIMFADGAELNVSTGGSVKAIGTETDSIVFTGAQKSAGYWDGISVGSNNPSNELQYCVIEYGGKSYGNVYANSSGQVTLHNNTIQHSGNYGVYKASTATINPTNWQTVNTVTDNPNGVINP